MNISDLGNVCYREIEEAHPMALLLPGADNPKKLRARGQKIIGSLLGSFRNVLSAPSRLDPPPHGVRRIGRRGVEANAGLRCAEVNQIDDPFE